MDDDNKLEYRIQIEDELATDFNPHNGKSVTMIQLKHEYIISQNKINYDEKLRLNIDENFTYKHFTVSDNKFVTVPIYEEKKKIGIFDFKTKNQLTLNLPGPEFDVGCLAFIESGEFIMVSYRDKFKLPHMAYVFTLKNSSELVHKLTMKLEYIDEIFIIPKGKLFMYNSDIGYITKWDIGTLKFESYFLFKSYYDVKDIKLSDDGLLLFVYGTKVTIDDDLDDSKLFENDSYSTISIYLAKNEMKFTTYIGARLLIMAHNTEVNSSIYEIRDPFMYSEPVDANKLLNNFENSDIQNQFQYPCIIKSKKIIGFINGNMNGNIDRKFVIKELIQDEKNWITFIRKTLKDSNNIYMSSLQREIIEFIEKVKTFAKYFVKWSVKCNKTNDILTAEFQETMDKINVRPEIYSEAKPFVIECERLDNDDLIMITQDEIMFIWTFSTKKKIQLIYLWKYNEVIDKLKPEVKDYFFPPPSYEDCVEHISFLQQNNTKRFFLNELVDEHIENEFFLILYGEKLIKVLIDEDQDTLLQKLCNRCVKIIFEIHINEFRKMIHQINSNDWDKTAKPFVSETLSKVLTEENQIIKGSTQEYEKLKEIEDEQMKKFEERFKVIEEERIKRIEDLILEIKNLLTKDKT
ncbi:3220_t:CDS:2 [Gigaspora margarita]|uniref:3220_t:CDS:1 n=1 Tax=Gigaspora margarita TaxID=4874 RepID=A0ABN7UJT8_GIGMA|nr:3220_t:CDS:2 [Gigaspora margarita]